MIHQASLETINQMIAKVPTLPIYHYKGEWYWTMHTIQRLVAIEDIIEAHGGTFKVKDFIPEGGQKKKVVLSNTGRSIR